MLTLGFTLPSFQLFFNSQPLPQRKVWRPVYMTFLTSKSDRTLQANIFPHNQMHRNISYNSVKSLWVFMFFCRWIPAWTSIFNISCSARDISSDFLYLYAVQVLSDQQLLMLLVHGFYLCLKDWSRMDIIVCCLAYASIMWHKKLAQLFLMLKISMLYIVTSSQKSFSNQAVKDYTFNCLQNITWKLLFFFFFYTFSEFKGGTNAGFKAMIFSY